MPSDAIRTCALSLSVLLGLLAPCTGAEPPPAERPNILFMIADDWGWPHAGVYGDPVVSTPVFDRLAREGVLFENAFVSSPSCTPSRNAILTGQYHWRLKEGANLWSTLRKAEYPVYPLLLERAGYHIGHWRKSWGPGRLKAGGWKDGEHPAGKRYRDGFAQFLAERAAGQPFAFWLGSSDPHRGYKRGSGRESGMAIDAIPVPGFWPDVETVRSDIADYYFEVQRFDRDCGAALALLEEKGELENTIVVMTGDHGMPFPRCKSNLYDMGVRVPLAIRWGTQARGGRRVADFVSFVDLAPSFLEAAGLAISPGMSGRSLLPILRSEKSGRIEPGRDHVLFGKERHCPAQLAPSMAGYPCRGIRTQRFLYIRNYQPELWPAGVFSGSGHRIEHHGDCDDGPTKSYLVEHREDPELRRFYELCFGRRPAEELYDLSTDPDQLSNLSGDPDRTQAKEALAARLESGLKEHGDPRAAGRPAEFAAFPYYGGMKAQKSR